MIFTDRTITVRKGHSSIDEPIVVYRGDYELEVRFKIVNSKFRFMSGTNLIESEKASYGQMAILTPYGGNIFSEVVRCSDGAVTFVLSADMLNQIEEVGLYSFQIRLFDYNRESRVSIPPIEFGLEVREPITSEDHDNSVNNAIVGYSIAKVVNPSEEKVEDTFDDGGNYNKTDWETGDRISEGKLNKIEDAIDMINRNEINNNSVLSKRIDNNFNVLNSSKADQADLLLEKKRIDSLARLGEGSTTGDAELIDGRMGVDGVLYDNIGEAIRNQSSNGYNIANNLPHIPDATTEIVDGYYLAWENNFGMYKPLDSVYTGVVRNVSPGSRYRVTVFTTNSKYASNTCNFYNSNGIVIPHGDDFYNYKLVDENNRVVEFTAPDDAHIMTYTNFIVEKAKGFCEVDVEKLNIKWLQIEYDNLDDNIKNDIINPKVLTTEGIDTSELNPITRDVGCFYTPDGLKTYNDFYNTAIYDVVGFHSLRIKTYSTDLSSGHVFYFWDDTGKSIDVKTYEYSIYDSTEKILDVEVPEGAVQLTVTELSNDPIWYVQVLGGKYSPDWLEVTPDMLSRTLSDTFENINNVFNLTTEGFISDNLIDKYEWGYYLSTSGIRVTNNTMGTAYFNAMEGITYRMTVYNVNYVNKANAVIYFWGVDGNIIPYTDYVFTVVSSNTNDEGIIDIVAPIGAVTGTITYTLDKHNNNWYVGQLGGKYTPKWLTVGKDNLNSEIYAKLYGDNKLTPYKYSHCLDKPFDFTNKTSVFFGDSITHGVTSPNLGYTSNSYGRLFANSVGMSYNSQAVSGSCFSFTKSPVTKESNICEKILSYTNPVDFIFIAGGTNDYSVGNPLGSQGDKTADTVYGALYLICEHIKENLPDSTVIFITPINQNIKQLNSIAHMNVYRNAIFEMATSYGFNVVDGTQIGFPDEPGVFADIMCSDGAHPTELGHEFYAKSLRGILL